MDLAAVAKIKRKCFSPNTFSVCYFVSPSSLTFDFSLLAEILIDLEGAIDSYEVSQDKGLTKPGVYVERMNINVVAPQPFTGFEYLAPRGL